MDPGERLSLLVLTSCVCVFQTDSKVNGTALSSPSTSSQRSDATQPLRRGAGSQDPETLGETPPHTHCWVGRARVTRWLTRLFPVAGDGELSSPSQDASGLQEVMEQLNNSFPHSQGRTHTHTHGDKLGSLIFGICIFYFYG